MTDPSPAGMIRAVLFDLMGTLLVGDPASEADPGAHFYRVMREAGLALDEEAFWATLRDTPPRRTGDGTTPFEDRLIRVCAQADLALSPERARRLAHDVCSFSNRVLVLDPEVPDTLATARRVGAIGLVTNYDHPPNIHHLLEREGLVSGLDTVVISGEVGVWKPDPAILQCAADRLGVAPGEAVYVGDSDVDIEAARRAGMPSILIRRDSGPSDPLRDPHGEQETPRPNAVISRLAQLAAALEHLDPPV